MDIARERLARALEAQDPEEADQLALEAVSAEPGLAAAYALRGRLAVGRGDPVAAAHQFRAAFTRGDRTRATRLGLCLCLEAVGERELAKRVHDGQGPIPPQFLGFAERAKAQIMGVRQALLEPLPEANVPALLPGERPRPVSPPPPHVPATTDQPSTASRFCPSCGRAFPPGTEVCPEHGELLEIPDSPAPEVESLIGRLVGDRYRVDSVLGVGGMATVYGATQLPMNRPVALKVLNAEFLGLDAVRRFMQEARAASAFSHPNAVTLYDFGQDELGFLYLVMEYLPGKTLAEILEEDGALSLTRTGHIARQLLNALEQAHQRGIVHRDLKPQNIILSPRAGDPDFLKILDFGLAVTGDSSIGFSQGGEVFGTPGYMAPEQARSQPATPRADLYSVGVLLYEMLAGQPPFEAESLLGLLVKHLHEKPRAFVDLNPPVVVPPALTEVVFRALSKDPADRFGSAAEMRDALKAALDEAGVNGSVRVSQELTRQRPRKPRRGLALLPSDVEFLKRVPLMRGLAPLELDLLAGCMSRHTLARAGEPLFEAGEPGDGAFIVREGMVAVVIPLDEGRRQEVARLGPRTVVGELCLVERGPRSFRVEAVEPSRLLQLDLVLFEELKQAFSPAAFKVVRNIGLTVCDRLRDTNFQIETRLKDSGVMTLPPITQDEPEEPKGAFSRLKSFFRKGTP